ncbi:MAG TPA: HAD hydrolase family protein, partial [Candidatus Limnocylindrales bacterium]|nr:HAD hydrolase family protein [Candidatus Limnocylindrales bacterium]
MSGSGASRPPVANLGRFRLVAVDIDGTLAGSDGRVTPRTVAALGRVEAAGVTVVLVTGRAYPSALEVWRGATLRGPLITCGGALTLEPPRLTVLDVHHLPNAAARQLVRLGRDLGLRVSLWTEAAIWITRDDRFAALLRDLHRSGSVSMEVRRLEAKASAPFPYGTARAIKGMLGGEPERLDELTPGSFVGLAGATVARSMPEFFDVSPEGASKHEALSAVLRRLDVRPDEVIAIGDGDNDLGMLRMAGLAVVP